MPAQRTAGHRLCLYTLTKGEATRQRARLGLSKAQMGQVRLEEMEAVARTLRLDDMRVDDFPDGRLADLDPRVLERAVAEHIARIRPAVVVTYPVYGVSGFHDHLVTHAVVKRVFLEMREAGADYLRRLAMLAMPDQDAPVFLENGFRIRQSRPEAIDCVVPIDETGKAGMRAALDCYQTYQQTIAESNVVERVGDHLPFELFGESFQPPLTDLTAQLP